jgi:hypothetical protein
MLSEGNNTVRICGACSTNGEPRNRYKILLGKAEEKRQLYGEENNIKWVLRGIDREDVNWFKFGPNGGVYDDCDDGIC